MLTRKLMMAMENGYAEWVEFRDGISVSYGDTYTGYSVFIDGNYDTRLRVMLTGDAGGTSYGSPADYSTNFRHVKRQNGFRGMILHALPSATHYADIKNNSDGVVIKLTGRGIKNLTGITRNGYTTSSQTSQEAMRVTEMIFWDHGERRAKTIDVNDLDDPNDFTIP